MADMTSDTLTPNSHASHDRGFIDDSTLSPKSLYTLRHRHECRYFCLKRIYHWYHTEPSTPCGTVSDAHMHKSSLFHILAHTHTHTHRNTHPRAQPVPVSLSELRAGGSTTISHQIFITVTSEPFQQPLICLT